MMSVVPTASDSRTHSRRQAFRKGGPRPGVSRQSRNATKVPGIHCRRNKRHPLAPRQIDNAALEAAIESCNAETDNNSTPRTSEALMLWLSWNSTFEKALAKMYRQGHDQRKVESLLDEMDLLRRQAVSLSEEIIRSESPA